MKKLGKTTRPSRYDLNQILCDYTLEVMNRPRDQIWEAECLKNYGQRFLTLFRNRATAENIAIPKEKKFKNAKVVRRRIHR